MGTTHFSGPVNSAAGFSTGTSASPVAITTASNLNSSYETTSATNGDSRLSYMKMIMTAAGSGETLRAYTSVSTGAGAVAPGGTINGAHVTLDIDGTSTVSGAGNALRATLGGTSTNPGGTLASIQADSNFATGGTWTNASWIRFTNSGTGVVSSLFNLPAAFVAAKSSASAVTHTLKIISDSGTPYYIMVSNVQ